MKVQEETETKILEKIKVKMERIKANQKKIQGAVAKEPHHHDAGKDIFYFVVKYNKDKQILARVSLNQYKVLWQKMKLMYHVSCTYKYTK